MLITTPPTIDSSGIDRRTTSGPQAQFPALDLTEERRVAHFSAVQNGEAVPVILLIGQPNSGKSFLMTMLAENGWQHADRYVARAARTDDLPTDVPWNPHDQKSPVNWPNVAFGHNPFDGTRWYVTRHDTLVSKATDSNNAGVFVQVGHPHDIPPLLESVRNVLPGTPVIPLRMYTPLEVIQERLLATRSPVEVAERLQTIGPRQMLDHEQLPHLVNGIGLLNLVNLSQAEFEAMGISPQQLRPLKESGLLETLVGGEVERAKTSAAQLATDILSERKLSLGMERVPDAVVHALQGGFLDRCREAGFEPIITSGLAAVLYGSPRRCSLDVDFGARLTRSAGAQMLSALNNTTGDENSLVTFDSALSPTLGIRAKTTVQATDETVDLDGLVVTRFRTHANGFAFEFPIDDIDTYCRRTVRLPNGETLGLVPPEHVLFYKLLAARGPELGKFDRTDANGIIANAVLDPAMVHKLIATQVFRPVRGSERVDIPNLPEAMWERVKAGTVSIDSEVLSACGIEHPEVQDGVRRYAKWIEHQAPLMGIDDLGRQIMALTALKQAAMVSRLLETMDKIAGEADSLFNSGELSDRSHYDANAKLLRNMLLFYGKFELGREGTYIFVNRGAGTEFSPASLLPQNIQA